ncbi:hypothetical protein V1634_29760 [Plantactinospora veratri]|uniref:Uncharacterized protein n=1 Tax=Plantactinospora veratri TaxID=1436122 RepID=A0ABU7SM45_9ACTN
MTDEERKRLLTGSADEGYLTYGDRLAHQQHALNTGNYLTGLAIEEAREKYNAEERRRVDEDTAKRRQQHRSDVEKLEDVSNDIESALVDLHLGIKERDVSVGESVSQLAQLRAQLDWLRTRRNEVERQIYVTEIIRANPHRYLDHFYQRFGKFLDRPSLTWSADVDYPPKRKRR